MRQVGILAAAGIYALEHNIARLRDDHEHRKAISDALEATGWADVRISSTNMIFFTASYPMQSIIEAFRRKGVLFLEDGGMGRIVTSLNVTDEDTDEMVRIIKEMDEKEFTA